MITNNIDELLNKMGKSRYWLAQEIGMASFNNLYKLADNKTQSIRFDNLELLVKALNCTFDEFFKIT